MASKAARAAGTSIAAPAATISGSVTRVTLGAPDP